MVEQRRKLKVSDVKNFIEEVLMKNQIDWQSYTDDEKLKEDTIALLKNNKRI
jgi:hypothetical protein